MSVGEIWDWAKPKLWPLGIGVVAGMVYVGSEFVPSSDVIASSPDRIIPAASRNYNGALDMAKGALNPDLLEVKVCDANTDEPGKEFLFVYDGKKNTGVVGPGGYIVTTPYEGDSWRCR